jgi:hypothetical protein
MNDNEEKIYDLIGSKSFAELTEDERAMVLESLGSEELYEKMREANLAAEEALSDELLPPPEMKAAVMAAFDKKDEKRGIVWWKYAAAVAVLVVGAFVLWPSGNLDREPIAENVERKDSTEQKKAAPPETKSAEETVVKSEPSKEETKAQSVELKPPTTTSNEPNEITDKVMIAESAAASPEEDLAEMEMDFADERADDQEVSTSEFEGLAEEENEVQSTPELADSFNASDTSPASSNESVVSNLNVESARSATTMSADLMKQGAAFEGISLDSIGGPDRNAYVAY